MTFDLKRLIKSGLNRIGLDVVRIRNSPRQTLLGLRSRPIQTIIDVGANSGQFASRISEYFPDATIYCFEPLPGPFTVLSEWANSQNGRVWPLNFAVGDKEGEVEIYLHEDHTPSSSLLATTKLAERYYPFIREQTRIVVRRKTLDVAFDEIRVKLLREILIKLDVQGYEDRVIAGGSRLFSEASACIVEVSVDALYKGQAAFADLLKMLDGLGFRYAGNLDQTYGDDGHCIFLDAVFLRRERGCAAK